MTFLMLNMDQGGQRKENGSRLLQKCLYLCQENECVPISFDTHLSSLSVCYCINSVSVISKSNNWCMLAEEGPFSK